MRWKSYILALTMILVLRFLDVLITYLYTPDLVNEWNPLVTLFGATWQNFIVTQIAIVGFIALPIFFYFNREAINIVEKGLSFHDFIYVYFFGKLKPWPARMLSRPTNWKRHLAFNGFVLMLATIIVSFFAIFHNLLLLKKLEFYDKFVAQNYAVYFPACFIVVAVFSVYCFFGIEYAKYKQEQKISA